MNIGRPVVTKDELDAHRARVTGVNDVIWNPLYDFAAYAAAGQQNLSFFTVPQGQGVTTAPGGAGAKTIHDTNLQASGQLTKGNEFFCTGVEVLFFPGQTSPERAAVTEATFITGAFLNDVYTVFRSGLLTLQVGSNRTYVQDTPLGVFPPTTRLYAAPALTGAGATANTFAVIDYAAASGEPYSVVGLYIEATQGFNVTLSWPGVVALPSTVAGRIGVRLRGYLIRNAQ